MNHIEEYLFWRLASFFIVEKEYRLLRTSPSHQELWLERRENKHFPLIRLKRVDLDWSNWLSRDSELAGKNGEVIRRQFIRREADVLNIYISAYPPVDDYEHLLTQNIKIQKTTIINKVITRKSYHKDLHDIEQVYNESIFSEIKDDYSLEEIESLKHTTLTIAVERVQKEKSMFENGKPLLTYVFMGIQILAFILLSLQGGSTNTATLIKYGAKFNLLILQGEWWRFFTPILLHIGIFHLVMNTLALYYLGPTIERIYGRLRFLFIYLLAGFSGSLASFLFSKSLSAGASGAIFGCFGALLYFGLTYRSLFLRTMGMNVLVVIAINLTLGFTIPGIDNAGHIGGLIGGFLAAAIVHFPKQKKWFQQLGTLVVTAGFLLGMLWYGYSNPDKVTDSNSIFILSQLYLQEEEYEQAYNLLSDAVDSQQANAEIYFQLSYVEIKRNELTSAEKHLLKTIELNRSFHEAYFNLALIYYQQGNKEASLEYVNRAMELSPSTEEYQLFLNKISE